MEPVLSIVIPTRNRLATLRRTVESWLRHWSRAPFELVVVDDGSEDGTGEYLVSEAAREPRLRALMQPASGPALARNRAIAESRGCYLLFAGDDIRPGEGLADGHVAAHEGPRAPRFVLGRTDWDPERPITGVMRHVTGFGGQQFRYDYLRDRERLGFKYFYGSNLSLRRSELDTLAEPFDPSFGGAALEDTDLGYRLLARRRGIEYRRGLLAFHDHPYDAVAFAERQQRVGRATAVLFAKHPGIASEFGAAELAKACATAERARSRGSLATLGELDEAERRIAEWLGPRGDSRDRRLDRVYLGYFWYHQAKGMVEAQVPPSDRAPVLGALMGRALACPLAAAAEGDASSTAAEDERLGLLARRLAGAAGRRRVGACLRWRLAVWLRERHHAACLRRAG